MWRELEVLDAWEEKLLGEIDRRSPGYIRWVQQSLNRILRAGLVEDGKLGPKTRSAVRRFQQQRGLRVDGIPGTQTERALLSAGANKPPAGPAAPGPAGSQTTPPASGACGQGSRRNCIRSGACQACECRIHSGSPSQLVPVPAGLLAYSKANIQLNARALAAFQKLIQDARTAGIPAPYLSLASGYRGYESEQGLWRRRLLIELKSLGCSDNQLRCVEAAIDATSQALRHLPLLHPRGAWVNHFLKVLQQTNCSVPCDVNKAIYNARWKVTPPGVSPHHTGRALDLFLGRAPGASSAASTKREHMDWQRAQPPFRWLVCNAARYGFFPYHYEPWHWEYNPPSGL